MTAPDADLLATLVAVVDVLDHANVRYAVIGGIAKAAWGRARATRDIDIALSIDAAEFASLQTQLRASGFVLDKMVGGEAGDERPDIFVARGPFGVPVDMLVAKTPFEEEAVARSVKVQLLGQAVQVVTAEDLVFYKLLAGRPRDRDDVLDVIRTQLATARAFDWDRLERLANDWGIEATLAEMRHQL